MKDVFLRKASTSTYVALIPKEMGAKELTHFRPISLISSVYTNWWTPNNWLSSKESN